MRSMADASRPAADLELIGNPWPLIRAGIAGVVLLLLTVGAWLAAAPLSGAVIAPGLVKVDMDRKTVQHQEGGIVGEILVRDGDKVKAGQPLLILKDVRVDATNELVQTQLDAEEAKAARLAAEQTWAQAIVFPPALMTRASDPRVADLLRTEHTVFATRRAAYESQLRLLRSQAAETESEIRIREQQLQADREAIRLQREELDANEALIRQGFVSKSRLLSLQRSLVELESRMGENLAEQSRARQKVDDLRLRAETLRTTYMQEAAGELRQTTAQVFDLRERFRPAQDAQERQRIVAPADGEVVSLKFTSVGAVIGPRDPILDIVPENPDLIIEARVRPHDINSVKPRAQADVRLTSFRARITPTVEGEVVYVSADRLTDSRDDREGYYLAHIRVTPAALRKAGDLKLQAGMPAEAYIKTEERTALEYMLTPLTAFLQRSMREP